MEAYNSTLVNSDIFFQCQQPGLVPSYHSATCGGDGRWSPDLSQVECRVVIPTPTGTTLPNCTLIPGTGTTGIYAQYDVITPILTNYMYNTHKIKNLMVFT